jgi:hypothetical protein
VAVRVRCGRCCRRGAGAIDRSSRLDLIHGGMALPVSSTDGHRHARSKPRPSSVRPPAPPPPPRGPACPICCSAPAQRHPRCAAGSMPRPERGLAAVAVAAAAAATTTAPADEDPGSAAPPPPPLLDPGRRAGGCGACCWPCPEAPPPPPRGPSLARPPARPPAPPLARDAATAA